MDIPEQDIPVSIKTQAHKLIDKEWLEIVQGLIDRAKGLYVTEMSVDGNINRYRKDPDREAAIFLINQKIGRPTEGLSEESKVIFEMDD